MACYFLGIDVGTTAVKIGLFSGEGRIKGIAVEEYKLETPFPDWVELNPEVYWDCVKRGVKKVIKKASVFPRHIKGVSVSNQGQTFIPLDKNMRPLANAIVWLDNRAIEETKEIKRDIKRIVYFRKTGIPNHMPISTFPKLLWLKKHRPKLFKKTAKFALLQEFLIERLCGTLASDYSTMVSSGYYEAVEDRYWQKALSIIGVDETKFSKVFPPATKIGKIKRKVSQEIGLSSDTWVITGSMDQLASAIGTGNIKEGVISEATGTALAIIASVKNYKGAIKQKIFWGKHSCPNLYFLLGFIATSGIILKWFRDNFTYRGSYSALVKEACRIPIGAEGIVMSPHFSGAISPEFNPLARGVISGLSLNHTRAHIVRAIMETICFSLREQIEWFEKAGYKFKDVISLGGASKSDEWLQMKADVLNIPVNRSACSEAACLGNAIFAMIGSGFYKNFESAVKRCVHIDKTFNPNVKNHRIYQDYYYKHLSLYKKLYKN